MLDVTPDVKHSSLQVRQRDRKMEWRLHFSSKSTIIMTSDTTTKSSLSGQAPSEQLVILKSMVGFNGERRDPVTDLYHLGSGQRVYSPRLMRFYSADSMSPFGAGGINSYAYCLGDPINFTDPSGHLAGSAWIGIGLGILGILFSIATLGIGIAAGVSLMAGGGAMAMAGTALGITSSILGIASASTGIASAALSESDPQLSVDLGHASFGLGVVSIITSVGGYIFSNLAMARAIAKVPGSQVHLLNPTSRFVGDFEVTAKGLMGHGYPFNAGLKLPGKYAVSGLNLGKMTGPFVGNEIRMTSCYGAVGGRISTAQLLANQTGVTVAANIGRTTQLMNPTHSFVPLTGLPRSFSNGIGATVSSFVRSARESADLTQRGTLVYGQQFTRQVLVRNKRVI
jgi:RHS repeat-associated protein